MARKLPTDAFTYYATLGPQRAYQAVADHYGVSKRAVVTLARKEKWQDRVVEIEQKARQGVEKKVGETIEEMTTRHVKMLHAIAGRALEALKTMPLDSAIDAVRALAIVIREEQSLRGEGSDQKQASIEEIIRGEYQRWLKPANDREHVKEATHGNE
jgi:hypothetical protein